MINSDICFASREPVVDHRSGVFVFDFCFLCLPCGVLAWKRPEEGDQCSCAPGTSWPWSLFTEQLLFNFIMFFCMDVHRTLLYKEVQLYLGLSVGTEHRTKAVLGKAL